MKATKVAPTWTNLLHRKENMTMTHRSLFLPLILTAYLSSQPTWADETEIATEVSVQTGKIISTTLHRYVRAYGTVEPEPATANKAAASAKVAAPVVGIVQQSLCEEGQNVQKNQLLFVLDSRAADDAIAKAQVAVDFAEKNLTRKQPLAATENISRKLYDEAQQAVQTARQDLKTAQTHRALLTITAPLAGIVVACHAKVGESVAAVVAEIIDIKRLVVSLRVPSFEATALRLKQSVSVDDQQQGKINFISPQVDPLTDSVLVRASLPTNTALRSGQFVSGRIVVEELTQRLAVPVSSVMSQDDKAIIAVVNDDTAKQREIKLGLRDGNLVEIQGDGLREGMTIVTEGVYGLPAESRIRVAH